MPHASSATREIFKKIVWETGWQPFERKPIVTGMQVG
jgi:hypothetical protein